MKNGYWHEDEKETCLPSVNSIGCITIPLSSRLLGLMNHENTRSGWNGAVWNSCGEEAAGGVLNALLNWSCWNLRWFWRSEWLDFTSEVRKSITSCPENPAKLSLLENLPCLLWSLWFSSIWSLTLTSQTDNPLHSISGCCLDLEKPTNTPGCGRITMGENPHCYYEQIGVALVGVVWSNRFCPFCTIQSQ